MKIMVHSRQIELRNRLNDRLDRAAQLRCAQHGQSVVAVTIHERENGWFDSMWTTCCPTLEREAALLMKDRC